MNEFDTVLFTLQLMRVLKKWNKFVKSVNSDKATLRDACCCSVSWLEFLNAAICCRVKINISSTAKLVLYLHMTLCGKMMDQGPDSLLKKWVKNVLG